VCPRFNVAAVENGGASFASHNQGGYHVSESNDGKLAPSNNGWAFGGGASKQSPRSAMYAFKGAKIIDTIEVLSGVGRSDHHIADFKIDVTTDAKPTLASSGKWRPVQDTHFLATARSGKITGNEVKLKGQHSVSVAFDPVKATAVKVSVLGTSASNGNVVLTEISVLGLDSDTNPKSGAKCHSECPRENVASAKVGGKATASHTQKNYGIEESINGVTEGAGDGWAFGGGASRHSLRVATYALGARSVIDQINIISGIDRGDHMVSGVKLYYTNARRVDAGSTWVELGHIRALDPLGGERIAGNEVMATGQHYMRLAFDPVTATGVKIELFKTNNAGSNVVLTELMVLGFPVQC